MTVRALQPADAVAVRALWNRSARLDPVTPALLEEKVWGDPDFRPELALVAEAAGRPVGFAMGVVRQTAAGPRGYVKLIAVDKAWRRQGIGGRLLGAVEAGLEAAGAAVVRVGEAAPNYLTPGLDVRYAEALRFFEQHGYARFGETYNLTVALARQDFATGAAEVRLASEGISVRRAQRPDRGAVGELLQRHWPAWQAEVDRSLANDPPSLHLAFDGAAVIGFAAYDGNNVGTGWFGPMGTDPAWQGHGVGGVLLRRCLGDLKAQGLAEAVIPWVGPVAFYARHAGAAIARVFWRYEKQLG